jgi:ABC-type glutathione transport system ATPase component
MSLLSVSDLKVYFYTRTGVVKAVDGVEFELQPGQTLGIVGESGSGKSVTCQSLLGLLPAPPARVESGCALFHGVDLLQAGESVMRGIRGRRIAMVFQDPMTSLNPYMTIGDQLREPLNIHLKLSRTAARTRLLQALEEVGLPDPGQRIDCYPHEFSGGMRQRVMIAMALLANPEILIADEPTTALDVTIQAQILDLIKRLQAAHHLAVIYVTHDLGVVAGLADRVLVMCQGAVVEQGSVDDIFYRPQADYTKTLLNSITTAGKPQPYLPPAGGAGNVLRVENLKTYFPARDGFFGGQGKSVIKAVDDVTLDLRRGEILGLVGVSGSGKSTTGRSVMRLTPVNSGNIRLQGVELTALAGEELRRMRPEFQMIFQDPYASLNPRLTVHDTLVEAIQVRGGRRSPEQMQREIAQLLQDVGLAPAHAAKYPHEFSGGQRQRVAIARAIAPRPKLLIADEPVSSLDVTIRAQILRLLLELNVKYALSMLFISHDLSVIRYLTDRTAVMYRGKIVEQADTETLFNAPQHPYTQALLAAIPVPDPITERRRRRAVAAPGR